MDSVGIARQTSSAAGVWGGEGGRAARQHMLYSIVLSELVN